MTPADREEAPRVLGVEMQPTNNWGWSVTFGALTFEIGQSLKKDRFFVAVDWVGATSRMRQTLGPFVMTNCVRHIERELLAIRAAIPAASTPPSPEPSEGGRERMRRFALCNHDILQRDCRVCREPIPSPEPQADLAAVVAARLATPEGQAAVEKALVELAEEREAIAESERIDPALWTTPIQAAEPQAEPQRDFSDLSQRALEALDGAPSMLAASSGNPDETQGLYRKFRVERLSDPAGKHAACTYFVIDERHDRFAGAALNAYADACQAEFPGLAHDLRARHPKPAEHTELKPSNAELDAARALPPTHPFEVSAFIENLGQRAVVAHATHAEKAVAAANHLETIDGVKWVQVKDLRADPMRTSNAELIAAVDAALAGVGFQRTDGPRLRLAELERRLQAKEG